MDAKPFTPKSKKPVCMIAYTNYPTDGRVRLEAQTLASWGREILFLVPKEGKVARKYQLEGVTVIELNCYKYRGSGRTKYLLSYSLFLLAAGIACTRLFLDRGLTSVHVHNMPDILVLAAIVPRVFACELILDVHDTVPETYAAKFGASAILFKLLCLEERFCCLLAHKIICVNHVQREALLRRGIPEHKLVTLVTMPGLRPCSRSTDAALFRVVNHGTISVRLGIDLLVRAIAKLAPLIDHLELHIYGRGDDAEIVTRLAENLGLNGNVRFHDVVPWDKLPAELAQMDVGVIANRVNPASTLMLPSKLIDYVSMGIPAVVPRLSGIEYYFSSEMVTYYEPENIESMAAAIMSLYTDKDRRQQQAEAAKKFLVDYAWESSQNGLAALYKRRG